MHISMLTKKKLDYQSFKLMQTKHSDFYIYENQMALKMCLLTINIILVWVVLVLFGYVLGYSLVVGILNLFS